MFADKVVFVEIFAPYASNNNKEAYITHSGFGTGVNGNPAAVRMNIQPMSAQMTILVEGVIGKTFTGFTTASGLVEGMRLTVSGTSQQFIVQGRQLYDYGPLQHSELVLFKRDPQ
jgi:hypothetical protein